VTLEFADVFSVIDQTRSYDRIYVDLVDPDMKDEQWRSLFKKLVGWLAEKGAMNINAGGVFPWDDGDVPAIEHILKEAMEGKSSYQIVRNKKWVPSFGREWAFVILKKL
jgi:predicted membrane-bound spermidine synthase